MEIKKVNFDRSKPSSSYIEQKQDFNKVLRNVKMTKTPAWKSPWFYGAVGLSSVAIAAVSLSSFSNENNLYEKKATLKKETIHFAAAASSPENELVQVKERSLETNNTSKEKKVKSSNSKIESSEKIVSVNEVVAEEIPVVKKQNHSGLPSINGISNGAMSAKKFQLSDQIESNSNMEIVSYRVQYYNGSEDIVVQVNGDKIPSEIKTQIMDYNMGQMIFFTDIKGVDEQGKMKLLSSMNFKLTN